MIQPILGHLGPATEVPALVVHPRYNAPHLRTTRPTLGARPGAYESSPALRAGGINDKYCARDTTLRRAVVFKALLPWEGRHGQ